MKVVTAVAVILMLCILPSACATDDSTAEELVTRVCTLKVSGMTCAGCEAAVRIAARSVEGVTETTASYARASAEIAYDPSKTTPQAIAKAITNKSGFRAELVEPARKPN